MVVISTRNHGCGPGFGTQQHLVFVLGTPAEYGKSESEGTVKVYNLSTGKLLNSKSGISADTVYGTVEVIKPVLRDHVAFVTQGPLAETQVFMYDTSNGSLVKPVSFSRTYLDCLVSTDKLGFFSPFHIQLISK